MTPTPRGPYRNSIAVMGFEAKFNHDYALYAFPGRTAFQTLGEMIEAGDGNSKIGRKFGRQPQAVISWRKHYERIKTKGL